MVIIEKITVNTSSMGHWVSPVEEMGAIFIADVLCRKVHICKRARIKNDCTILFFTCNNLYG